MSGIALDVTINERLIRGYPVWAVVTSGFTLPSLFSLEQVPSHIKHLF